MLIPHTVPHAAILATEQNARLTTGSQSDHAHQGEHFFPFSGHLMVMMLTSFIILATVALAGDPRHRRDREPEQGAEPEADRAYHAAPPIAMPTMTPSTRLSTANTARSVGAQAPLFCSSMGSSV